ncbi:MAG: membrane protein insertion efficiency factor YidD [Chthoniobacterales bacterium]
MSALRQSLKQPWLLVSLGVALVLAAVALGDWRKPADAQTSVRCYNRIVYAGYHEHIRPFTSHFVHCRFQPTCSAYSLIAMQTHGFPKGLWLTVKRLCRCLPWVPFGTYDPVPPRTPITAYNPSLTSPPPTRTHG